MNNTENTDQIVRYDTGEMEEGERLAFEARLAEDAELRADYAAYRSLAGFLRQVSEGRQLRAQLENLREQAPQKPVRGRVIPINFRLVIAVAASFALLLSAMWWWQGHLAGRQLEELAASNLPGTTALIRHQLPAGYGSNADAKAYQTVLELIEQGNAAAALPVLDQVTPGPFAEFLRGICLSISETPAKAIPILKPFAGDPESSYRQAAAWHLALVYARIGEKDSAEKMIRTILADANSSYLEGAKKLQALLVSPFGL